MIFFEFVYRSRVSRGPSQRVQNPSRSSKMLKYVIFIKFQLIFFFFGPGAQGAYRGARGTDQGPIRDRI